MSALTIRLSVSRKKLTNQLSELLTVVEFDTWVVDEELLPSVE